MQARGEHTEALLQLHKQTRAGLQIEDLAQDSHAEDTPVGLPAVYD